MSLTAVAWLTLYCVGCALALWKNPIYGLATYLLEYFNHPASYWWGKDIPSFRWALAIAAITFISWLIHRKKYPSTSAPPYKWLIGLVCVAGIVTYTSAASLPVSQEVLVVLIKLALLYFLIVNIVQTERDYHILIWAIIIGCFIFGWRAYQNPTMHHGRLEGVGAVDAGSANTLAALLLIPLPFLGFYLLMGRRWERALSLVLTPFIVNAIILAGSRGAFLGLLAMGAVAIGPGVRILRMKFIIILVLGMLAFAVLADTAFISRMVKLRDATDLAQDDGSVSGRLISWKAGWQLALDHPFGVGGEGFRTLSSVYVPEIVLSLGEARAPHNTYVKVLTDWGFLGAGLWLLFLIHTWGRVRRLRKTSIQPRHVAESVCIEAALVGFLVAGIFTDRLYAEALYWLCALSVCLYHIAMRAQQAEDPFAEDSGNLANRWLVRMQLSKAYRTLGYAMSSNKHRRPPARLGSPGSTDGSSG